MTDIAVDNAVAAQAPSHGVSFAEATRVWFKIAMLSFGGPASEMSVDGHEPDIELCPLEAAFGGKAEVRLRNRQVARRSHCPIAAPQ